MEYELEMIINQIKGDKTSDPKWRNKLSARLEEVQAMLWKLHPPIIPNQTPAETLQPAMKAASMSDIPESLRDVADPIKLQP